MIPRISALNFKNTTIVNSSAPFNVITQKKNDGVLNIDILPETFTPKKTSHNANPTEITLSQETLNNAIAHFFNIF